MCLFGAFGQTEIPFKRDAFTFGVTHHSFAIASELGIVTREEHEAGQYSSTELFDDRAITELAVDLPMGGDRAEVHNASVGTGGRTWIYGQHIRHNG